MAIIIIDCVCLLQVRIALVYILQEATEADPRSASLSTNPLLPPTSHLTEARLCCRCCYVQKLRHPPHPCPHPHSHSHPHPHQHCCPCSCRQPPSSCGRPLWTSRSHREQTAAAARAVWGQRDPPSASRWAPPASCRSCLCPPYSRSLRGSWGRTWRGTFDGSCR